MTTPSTPTTQLALDTILQKPVRGIPSWLIDRLAGVPVTRTLPMGKPADVKREMEWLVKNGPRTGLFLGGSSSIAPGVSRENMQALAEGLRYYREHGR